MIYNNGISKGIKDGLHKSVIARKIYLSYPTFIFKDEPEREFSLLNEIRNYLNLSLSSIQVVGSSKTGYSYYKNRNYIKGKSDLDIAIIDQTLFLNYAEEVFDITNGFRNLSSFGMNEDISNYDFYSSSILKGIFRPDLMPSCDLKRNWFNFFNKLSESYNDLFSDINAGIYLNEYYFEIKQSQNVDWFKKDNK